MNRVNKMVAKKIIKKCKIEKCKFKTSSECGDMFCGKHYKYWYEEKMRKKYKGQNIKFCTARTSCGPDYEKGEKAVIFENDITNTCAFCREHETIKSTGRRNVKKKLKEETIDKYVCTTCPTGIFHEENTMGVLKNGQISSKCRVHLEAERKVEANRPDRDRKEEYKIYESKPERKAAKKQWKKDNPDKVYNGYTSYRARQLTENPEEYRAKIAEQTRKWRIEHPEKVAEINLKRRLKPNYCYDFYVCRAARDGYDFDLTFEELEKLVKKKCYFCNCDQTIINGVKRLNGIDRLDNNLGYLKDNIVACCRVCNMMKNTLNEATFILMCSHIANYSGFVKEVSIYKNNLVVNSHNYEYVFNNYVSDNNYNRYRNRAGDRNKEFDISKDFYEKLKKDTCYLCGKKTQFGHVNGIDRINDKIGYVESNCASCCGNCNYLKRNYKLFDFIFKCCQIFNTHKNKLNKIEEVWTPSCAIQKNVNKKKLSVDEKNFLKIERDTNRHQKTMATKTRDAILNKMKLLKI